MTRPFLVGHVADPDWRAAVRGCLAQIGPTEPEDNLGFVYVGERHAGHLTEIVGALRSETGIQTWSGTSGMGVLANEAEYFDQPAVVVLIGSFPKDSFRPLNGPGGTAGAATTFAVVHADSTAPDVPRMINALSVEQGHFLVGGLTLPDSRRVESGETGCSGIAFAPTVEVATGVTQGCSPIGPIHEVTDCDGHIAIRIDDRPALEVFKDDIGDVLARRLDRIGGYIFAALPVSGTDTGDYLVRNIVGIDPENGLLAVAADLSRGDRIMFCRRDRDSAEQDLDRMLGQLKRRVGDRPRGALYFSCLARGPNLFGPNSEEIRRIQAALGSEDEPLPIVGFFANGEISNDRLYTYTGVLTLFM